MTGFDSKRQAAQQAEPCIGKDPRCPCQDGDACHYKDCGGTKARPVPQAEPVAWMSQAGNFLSPLEFTVADAALYGWTPVYTAPPAAQWDKPSANFNAWWDSNVMPPANPFAEGSAAYWAWAGWEAAQRPWQGLTDEDKKKIATAAGCTDDDDGHIVTEIFRLAEDKLKERNT